MNFISNLFCSDDTSKPEGFPLPLKHIQTIRLMAVSEAEPSVQMPIIENMCPLYEGFYFYDMKTPREELVFRLQQAADNFKLLMQKFTLPEKTNA